MGVKIECKNIILYVFFILLIGCSGKEKEILKRENSSLRLALENQEKLLDQIRNEREQMKTNLIETINSNLVLTERISVLENSNNQISDFNRNNNFYSDKKIAIWNIAIDRITRNLELLRRNPSYPDLGVTSLTQTDYKLLSLEIVDELEIQNFPRSALLKKQIELFISNHSAYLASIRNLQSVQPFYALPGTGPGVAAAGRKAAYLNKRTYQKINQAISTYKGYLNSNISNIKRLKIKPR